MSITTNHFVVSDVLNQISAVDVGAFQLQIDIIQCAKHHRLTTPG